MREPRVVCAPFIGSTQQSSIQSHSSLCPKNLAVVGQLSLTGKNQGQMGVGGEQETMLLGIHHPVHYPDSSAVEHVFLKCS